MQKINKNNYYIDRRYEIITHLKSILSYVLLFLLGIMIHQCMSCFISGYLLISLSFSPLMTTLALRTLPAWEPGKYDLEITGFFWYCWLFFKIVLYLIY